VKLCAFLSPSQAAAGLAQGNRAMMAAKWTIDEQWAANESHTHYRKQSCVIALLFVSNVQQRHFVAANLLAHRLR
jgi:hypothetical protein